MSKEQIHGASAPTSIRPSRTSPLGLMDVVSAGTISAICLSCF